MKINPRVLAFGDEYGLPMLLRHLPRGALVGIVASSLRPGCFEVLRTLANREQVPFAIQPRTNSTEYTGFLDQAHLLNPDFIIVHSYSQRLPSDLLSCAARAAVNVHAALLPRYRGPNPVQWAMIAGERTCGVTMHHLTDRFDAGDIVAQRAVPIAFSDTWRDVYSRLEVATDALLTETMPALLEGRSARTPQDEAAASSFSRRRPEDGRISWDAAVVDIYNLIRALVSPLPGASYEEADGIVVVDQYLRIPEVVDLKFAQVGGAWLTTGALRLIPCTPDDTHRAGLSFQGVDRASSNDWFALAIADQNGHSLGCSAWSIDWPAESASVSVRLWDEVPDHWADVSRLLRMVSCDELRLKAISVDGLPHGAKFV